MNSPDLRPVIERLFFAYRNFTAEADAILAVHDFGRAHHRVIYFIQRTPGLSVNELLDVLQITKQSLSRVLRQLMDEGFVKQETDAGDRRKRVLTLTEKGQAMERDLSQRQAALLASAFEQAGGADAPFVDVLDALMSADDRARQTQ